MEERKGRNADCRHYPDGFVPPDIPLDSGERVFGVYKNRYHFTPVSLVVLPERARAYKIRWTDVVQYLESGPRKARVRLRDGSSVTVDTGEMSPRISQLLRQLIERHGGAAIGPPVIPAEQFFAQATRDECLAPNLSPHPTLEAFRAALSALERETPGTRIFFQLTDDFADAFAAEGLVIVSAAPSPTIDAFVTTFRVSSVRSADQRILRWIGATPAGFSVLQLTWD
jgi:hypothetical protein